MTSLRGAAPAAAATGVGRGRRRASCRNGARPARAPRAGVDVAGQDQGRVAGRPGAR